MDILAIATKKVQLESFALTDFYGLWLDITIRLEKSPHIEFASLMLHCLKLRKGQLLEHPAMICGIFFDPRYHSELTSEQKFNARLMIKKIWFRLQRFNNAGPIENEHECSLVEKYFIEKGQVPTQYGDTSNITTELEFTKQLAEYENNLVRLHSSYSIIDFWTGRIKQSKHVENLVDLKEIAINLIAVPSTQVPCERSFSHLSFVFSKHRSRLDLELLEYMLIIRLNRDLWEEVKSSDRKSI